MEKGSGVYRGLLGKPKEKKPLEKLRCKWRVSIKMGVWTGLGWLRIETGGGHL
jgi:hypothetical protein